MTYKKRFQKIRTDFGLSRQEFAEIMQVDVQTVLEWENGLEQPGIKHFNMINRKFNIPLNELIKDIPVPERKPINLVKNSEVPDNSVPLPVQYDFDKVQMDIVRKKIELIKGQKEKDSEKYSAWFSIIIFIIFVIFLLLLYFE